MPRPSWPSIFGLRRSAVPLLVLVSALLGGCGSHPLVLKVAYGRVDNVLAGRFLSLADFSSEEQAVIHQRVDRWHAWHRRDQLPRYAATLRHIAEGIAVAGDALPRRAVVAWATELDSLYLAVAACHPLRGSGAFLADLPEARRQGIARALRERHRERDADAHASDAPEKRLERTVNGLSTLGFTIHASDRQRLADLLAQRHEVAPARRAALAAWEARLAETLTRGPAQGRARRLEQQLGQVLTLTRSHAPEVVSSAIDAWVSELHGLTLRQSPEERAALVRQLAALADTLDALARAPSDSAFATAQAAEGDGHGACPFPLGSGRS